MRYQTKDIEIKTMSTDRNSTEAPTPSLPDHIDIRWTVDDVSMRCAEVGIALDGRQKRQVLIRIRDNHDATVGVNWDVIDSAIGGVLHPDQASLAPE